MNNNNTISLPDLKGYNIAPPSFLFDNIKARIIADDEQFEEKLHSLFTHSVQPPASVVSFGAIMNRIKKNDELNNFKPLRNYEIAAPFTFTAIMEKIRLMIGNTKVTSINSARVISFSNISKKIVAAAAVLLLFFVGYFTFKNNKINTVETSNAATMPQNNTTPITHPNTNIQPTIVADSNLTKNNILSTFNNIASTKKKQAYKKDKRKRMLIAIPMKEIPVATELDIAGTKMPIIDNDYLASFAALNESNLPAFLQADKPVATTITIDDYTYITISESMGGMMKKMYKTRKSGKPTRRARKTKEKLEKWKKADADYFNQNSTMNPLDPIDLGNFIFNK